MEFSVREVKFKCRTIEKNMLDSEIFTEIRPNEIALGELAFIIESDLLSKEDLYILYIRDKDGVLRAVRVHWNEGKWIIGAFPAGGESDWWLEGHVVVSSR